SIDRGFIDQLNFTVNKSPLKTALVDGMQDVMKLTLPNPLLPGGSVIIKTPFRVKVPKGIYSRLGHIGESYQVTQWFPKPAVYDENGWHPIPYLSQGEFFSEYGTYDVKITLPKNYVVGATGDLIGGEAELNFLNDKVAETEELIKAGGPLMNKAGLANLSFPASAIETKTLHYHQENVHDFAWFADKRFHVLKGEVALPVSGRKVTTWAMFTNAEFSLWEKAIEYLNDATFYYSKWTGEYPYNHVTAVDGSISAGGGMEYPNVTVIGSSYTDRGLEQVIVHEVGHNWFYGLLGSNERYNAWMDEGLNTFTENRYTETKYAGEKLNIGIPNRILKKIGLDDYGPRGIYDIGYVFNARRNYDQPIQTRSDLFTPMNYGAIVYGKTAIGFDLLLAYLGDEMFDNCMHAYFEEWCFKHPNPKDVEEIFERVSGKSLDWLFEDFIKSNEKIDYKIVKTNTKDGKSSVVVKNLENIAAPFSLTVLDKETVVETIWVDGFVGSKEIEIPLIGTELVLDRNKDIPELNRTNNHYKLNGMFKKTEPISVELIGSFEKEEVTSVYWMPIIGWNDQDKFMAGLALYNKSFPEKKFEWLAAPMYAFGSNSLVGVGDIGYNFYSQGMFRRLSLGYSVKSFNSIDDINVLADGVIENVAFLKPWVKHQFSIESELNNGALRKAKHNIDLRGIYINEKDSLNSNDQTQAVNLTYRITSKQVLKPASIKFNFVALNSEKRGFFTGVSAEAKVRKNYNVNLDGIELRLFAGQTLGTSGDYTGGRYNWSLSGQNGATDYLYDHTLLGRGAETPNMLNQQSTASQGDFKVASKYLLGSNDQWIASLNLKVEIPRLPIGVFGDFGVYPTKLNGVNKIATRYDFGLYLPIRKDIFEIYFPIGYSPEIRSALEYSGITYLQQIRFVLKLNEVNPFKLIKDIAP
ncbi:MAG: hypothetical protein ACI9N1_002864, partial [Flavobacteriales bacterium]